MIAGILIAVRPRLPAEAGQPRLVGVVTGEVSLLGVMLGVILGVVVVILSLNHVSGISWLT